LDRKRKREILLNVRDQEELKIHGEGSRISYFKDEIQPPRIMTRERSSKAKKIGPWKRGARLPRIKGGWGGSGLILCFLGCLGGVGEKWSR